jgi:hypothetical protein
VGHPLRVSGRVACQAGVSSLRRRGPYEPRLPRTQARTEAKAGAAERRRLRLGRRRRRWRLGRLSGSEESFVGHPLRVSGRVAKRRMKWEEGERAFSLTTVQMRDERSLSRFRGQ